MGFLNFITKTFWIAVALFGAVLTVIIGLSLFGNFSFAPMHATDVIAVTPVSAATPGIMTLLTFVVSTAGTVSAIWLAWRTDQRQAREFSLKLSQLEIQLAQARSQQNASPDRPK